MSSLLSVTVASVALLAGDPNRPQLRFSPRSGWANDPNGLSYYRGEWHLFHQYNPYGVTWGHMHWNHAVSRDLLHWTELGPVLAPDELGAMFSGSAVVDHENTAGFGKDAHVLVYTSMGKRGGVQCLAYSTDGRHYVKYAQNPVLESVSREDRDPKVFWHKPSGRWVMALYGVEDGRHSLWIYSSADLKSWRKESTYAGGVAKDEDYWLAECPLLEEFAIEGEAAKVWVVWGGGDGLYAVGDFDGRVFTPREERIRDVIELADSPAYYAAQTFSDVPDGRKLWLPWLRLKRRGDAVFTHAFGLPQELTLRRTKDGLRVVRRPARELKSLRIGKALPFDCFSGELAEVSLKCRIASDASVAFDLRGLGLIYSAKDQTLSVLGRSCPWPLTDGVLELTAYLDRGCAELFSADGLRMLPIADFPVDASRQTLSVRYPGNGKENGVQMISAEAYRLKSIWE